MKQTSDKVFVDTNVWVYFYSVTEPLKQQAAASFLEKSKHDAETIREALKLLKSSKYSYYDSLIIAAALLQGCGTLLSEDMHNTHLINEILRIQNPF